MINLPGKNSLSAAFETNFSEQPQKKPLEKATYRSPPLLDMRAEAE